VKNKPTLRHEKYVKDAQSFSVDDDVDVIRTGSIHAREITTRTGVVSSCMPHSVTHAVPGLPRFHLLNLGLKRFSLLGELFHKKKVNQRNSVIAMLEACIVRPWQS